MRERKITDKKILFSLIIVLLAILFILITFQGYINAKEEINSEK